MLLRTWKIQKTPMELNKDTEQAFQMIVAFIVSLNI